MENTYLYYPLDKVFRILSQYDFRKKGYRLSHADPEAKTLIIRRPFLFRKYFFELKLTAAKENITQVSIDQIHTKKPSRDAEKSVVEMVLRIF